MNNENNENIIVKEIVIKNKVGRPRKIYTKDELKQKLDHFREYQRDYQRKAYQDKIIKLDNNDDNDDIIKNYTRFKNYSKAF